MQLIFSQGSAIESRFSSYDRIVLQKQWKASLESHFRTSLFILKIAFKKLAPLEARGYPTRSPAWDFDFNLSMLILGQRSKEYTAAIRN
jgi:hypothetical protein